MALSTQDGDAPEARAAPARPDGEPPRARPPLTVEPTLPVRRRGRLARVARPAATGLILLCAAFAALLVWEFYVTAPWTRDGRVRVQVARVAPQVSGQITELRTVDNQFVRKGDVLFVIDPFDYRISLDSARAEIENRAADLQVKRAQAARREALTTVSTSIEEKQQYAGIAKQAEAAYATAQAQAAQAEINLKRTEVRSPVNGFVTNLLLRAGDYATAGTTTLSVIDSDSFWVDGYFEETKMSHIRIGYPVEIALMGYVTPLAGTVETITRGISTANATASTQGLPSVDPVYTWVRLAQRVPVRIRIDTLPAGVALVAGMTATVTVRDPARRDEGPVTQAFQGLREQLGTLLGHVPKAEQEPAPTTEVQGAAPVSRIDVPKPTPAQPAEVVAPGLAPGIAVAPRSRSDERRR